MSSAKLILNEIAPEPTTMRRFVVSNDWPRIESPSIWRALIWPKIFLTFPRLARLVFAFRPINESSNDHSFTSRGFLDSALLRFNTDA
jgi:hypothetical protein